MADIRETTPAAHALRLIREEHGRMLDLLVECAKAEPSAKREIADNLIAEAQLHILMAQELVFAAADRVARSPEAIERVDSHSAEIDRLAEEMAEVRGDDPRFQALHDGLEEHLLAHIQGEEAELFPELAKIGDEELISIGQKMLDRRERALHELDEGPSWPPAGPGGR